MKQITVFNLHQCAQNLELELDGYTVYNKMFYIISAVSSFKVIRGQLKVK